MGTQLGHSDTVGTSSSFVKRERVPHFGTHGLLVSSAPAVSTGDPPDTLAQETGKAPKPSRMHTSTLGCITRRSLEELQDSKHPRHGLPKSLRAQHGTAGGWLSGLRELWAGAQPVEAQPAQPTLLTGASVSLHSLQKFLHLQVSNGEALNKHLL